MEKIREGIKEILDRRIALHSIRQGGAVSVITEGELVQDEILNYLHSNGLDYYLDATNKLPLDYSKPHWGLKW